MGKFQFFTRLSTFSTIYLFSCRSKGDSTLIDLISLPVDRTHKRERIARRCKYSITIYLLPDIRYVTSYTYKVVCLRVFLLFEVILGSFSRGAHPRHVFLRAENLCFCVKPDPFKVVLCILGRGLRPRFLRVGYLSYIASIEPRKGLKIGQERLGITV